MKFLRNRIALNVSLLALVLLSLLLGGCNNSKGRGTPAPNNNGGGEEPLVEENYQSRLECDVKIPMRDGIVLSANISRPDVDGQFPVLLTTTPYGKDLVGGGGGVATASELPDLSGGCLDPGSPETIGLAKYGYIVISVDWRGTGKSGPGDWYTESWRTDHEDMLDWIQQQSWSNNQVGVTGCSNLGGSTIVAATADQIRMTEGKPRAVYAIWAESFFPDVYRAVVGAGSASTSPAAYSIVGLIGASSFSADPANPSLQPNQPILAKLSETTAGTSSYDDFWRTINFVPMASEIDIPVAMTAAIDDLWQLSLTSFDYAQRLEKSPHVSFFLSPGGHCAQGGWDKFQYAGKANDSKASLVKAWFDHWLKSRDNGVAHLPKFNVFPEGAETWTVQSSAIPAEQTQFTRFYLNSDGKLLESAPAAAQQTLVCLPCAPSVSGPSLVFDAPILDEAMTLAGAVSGFLNIDADRADSAFSVGLFFVDADGTENLISDAQIRARDRALDEQNSLYDEYGQLLHPRHKLTVEARQVIDGVYRYPLSFMPAAHRIPAGSFIRLRVAFHESKYVLPFDLQTSMLGTTLTLHTGGGLASEIILPVIPDLK
jgi:predicted acyl esterase